MENLASSIRAFVTECCITRRNAMISKRDLHQVFCCYCDDCGMSPLDRSVFDRDLLAVLPHLRTRWLGPRGVQVPTWVGVGLNKLGQRLGAGPQQGASGSRK
jgi:hypothetical protein